MSDRALLDYRPRHDDASVSSLSDAAPVSGLGSTNKEDRSSRPRTRRHTGKREWSLHAWLFGAVIAAILYFGWKRRDTGYLTPEEGLGYALGITGSCIMLILLLYPLRKRIRFMRGWGRIKIWFQTHMLLGIVGPTLVIYHTNFALGSLNSTVALVSMLVVVASGIVGRYLYAKIHMGLYGKKAEIRELLEDADAFKRSLGFEFEPTTSILEALRSYERSVLQRRHGLVAGLWLVFTIRLRTAVSRLRVRRDLRRLVRAESARKGLNWWNRRQAMKSSYLRLEHYYALIHKAAVQAFYDRLFGFWHLLHLPLFVVLFLSVVGHIVAVHMY